MDSVKMYSIVGPMLTPGARQMLAGDVVMADTLLGSSNDVGVMLKCIEGLAGVCQKTGMSLGGVVQKAQELGSLGAAGDVVKAGSGSYTLLVRAYPWTYTYNQVESDAAEVGAAMGNINSWNWTLAFGVPVSGDVHYERSGRVDGLQEACNLLGFALRADPVSGSGGGIFQPAQVRVEQMGKYAVMARVWPWFYTDKGRHSLANINDWNWTMIGGTPVPGSVAYAQPGPLPELRARVQRAANLLGCQLRIRGSGADEILSPQAPSISASLVAPAAPPHLPSAPVKHGPSLVNRSYSAQHPGLTPRFVLHGSDSLGAYLDSFSAAAANAKNANLYSSKALKATDKAQGQSDLKTAQGYMDTAWTQFNAGTADCGDLDYLEQQPCLAVMQGTQPGLIAADAQVKAAKTHVASLPSGVPPVKTCPAGQHLDANNNCVADTPTVTVNTGSSTWPIIGGILAGLGALYLWAESQKKKHPKRRAAAA